MIQFYVSADFDLPLPDGHRFPGQKYGMLKRYLLEHDILTPAQVLTSPRADRDVLLTAHSVDYVDRLTDGTIDPKIMRRIGFPWSEQIPRRGERTVGGALAAACLALKHGLSGQMAGGTHHAHRDEGAGFCIYNDMAAVSLTLLNEGAVDRVAIVDLDVHQGDGNASILAEDPRVFILDLHGAKNFPFRKVPSGYDVPLPDNMSDGDYLSVLDEHLPAVWAFAPDLVLYQAGVDSLFSDRLGRLDLSFDGLMERDRMVLEGCRQRGIPCSMAIGGGYAEPIEDTVLAYANTYRVAKSIYGF
ncbi:histone deacetylase [Parvularcula sp. LCG005]|uniref:histone deacetylase family protein n=1 Tax=Parvularcula sp. LCG005 TaxID=3078805 RepID=UPI00294329E5|nr:histone deacetylase [Parvularcula sp. LCG005]WOI53299.1 histone deacetylase [Parvularcula sp. LCG005]